MKIKIVSLDIDGTLTTPSYTDFIWEEAIPRLYSKKMEMDFDKAKAYVMSEYEKVGEERLEWYDIKYWFEHFGIGDYKRVLERHRDKVTYYPEVKEALESLSQKYRLIITTNSTQEFIKFKLQGIKNYFTHVFSAPSDFNQTRKTEIFYRSLCTILKIEPSEIAHTGDHWLFDFVTPRRAGIEAFYLDRSESSKGELVVRDLIEFEEKITTR